MATVERSLPIRRAARNSTARHRLATGVRFASWLWIAGAAVYVGLIQSAAPSLGPWESILAAALVVAPGALAIFLSWFLD
jgi:hypothetical protein